jgi:uncharacterized protein (TIGR02646 family)
MKKINKKQPDFYKAFLEKNTPRSWETLTREIGYDIRRHMLTEEQNFQCAYTETRLDPSSGQSHTDHFKKQNLFPDMIFEWDNLFTACNNEYYGAKFKDRNIKKADYQYLINPAKEDPQKHFSYSMTGEVLADHDDEKGKLTIDSFNLNDYALREQRKQVAYHIKAMHKDFSCEELVGLIGKFESFIKSIYADLKTMA